MSCRSGGLNKINTMYLQNCVLLRGLWVCLHIQKPNVAKTTFSEHTESPADVCTGYDSSHFVALFGGSHRWLDQWLERLFPAICPCFYVWFIYVLELSLHFSYLSIFHIFIFFKWVWHTFKTGMLCNKDIISEQMWKKSLLNLTNSLELY